jgi:hypothetical protein
MPSPLSASLTSLDLFYLYSKNIGGALQLLNLMLWYARPKRLGTPAVDMIREVPVFCSSLNRDTDYHDIFNDFPQFSQLNYGISRLEQGLSFKILCNS